MATEQEQFEQIAARVAGLGQTDQLEQRLLEYTPALLRSFETTRINYLINEPTELVSTSKGYLLHSTCRPAYRDFYYLFGETISQSAWFRVLGYSPEEQLMHVLQWG